MNFPGVKALPSLRPALITSGIWSDDGQVVNLQGSYANYSVRNVLDTFLTQTASEFRFTFQNTCRVDHCSFGVLTSELSTRLAPVEILFKGLPGFAGNGIPPNETITSDWMPLGQYLVPGSTLVVILDISATAPTTPVMGQVRAFVIDRKEVSGSFGVYSDWVETFCVFAARPGCFYKAATDSYNIATVPYSGWTDTQLPVGSQTGIAPPVPSPTAVYGMRSIIQLRQVEAR